MMPKFDQYIEGGYWVHREDPTMGLSSLVAIIKLSRDGWYGGACEGIRLPVPLDGPYARKRSAKKKALEQLALLREDDAP